MVVRTKGKGAVTRKTSAVMVVVVVVVMMGSEGSWGRLDPSKGCFCSVVAMMLPRWSVLCVWWLWQCV